MSEFENTGSKLGDRLIEVTVLCAAFYTASRLLAVDAGASLFMHIAIYSMVVILSLSLSQKFLCAYESIGEVSRYLLGNAVGIFIGTCLVLLLQYAVFRNVGFFAEVIFSSVIAFFVLGTISPIVYRGADLYKLKDHIQNHH